MSKQNGSGGTSVPKDSKLSTKRAQADKRFAKDLVGLIREATKPQVPRGTYGVTRSALARVRTQVPPGQYHSDMATACVGVDGWCVPRPVKPRPGQTDPTKTAG